jgi:hypothetical protein
MPITDSPIDAANAAGAMRTVLISFIDQQEECMALSPISIRGTFASKAR